MSPSARALPFYGAPQFTWEISASLEEKKNATRPSSARSRSLVSGSVVLLPLTSCCSMALALATFS